jgi:hypothetical protein
MSSRRRGLRTALLLAAWELLTGGLGGLLQPAVNLRCRLRHLRR